MKKTLRTILAGAIALLAVSCYDDSELRGQIDDLADRVTKLENTLNAEVGGINDLANRLEAVSTLLAGNSEGALNVTELISSLDAADGAADGKINGLADAIAKLKEADEDINEDLLEAIAAVAVVAVTEEDGNIVLSLADGSKVSLSKPVSNADNTNLVTIVEEDGVKYWAVVLADGTTQKLDVPVGVDLKFRVTDNALEYSVNGSEWEETGAYVANSSYSLLTDFYQGGEMDFDTWEYVADDFYTLVFGGEEFQLPLYKVDNSVVTIRAGKTYFEYGDTFTVEVSLKDISTMYLMTKPDGWKAKLVGTTLTVTAPSETAVQSGDAESDGEVLLHCTTAEGKCKIARLAVATTAGFSLTVTEDGQVTIVNPEVVTMTNSMIGSTWTDFNDAYIGLAPVSAFEADPAAYVGGIADNYDDVNFMISNWKSNTTNDDGEYTVGGAYDPENYTVDVINTTVNAMYRYRTYSDLPYGSNYVVWACPVDESGMPRVEDVVYGYFSLPVVAEISAVEGGTTTSNIALNVNVLGAETYYVGLVTEEMLYGFPVDDYMQMSEGPFGYMQKALQYGMPDYAMQMMGTMFGGENGEEMPETLMASDILGGALLPSSKVYMWVFPIIDGLALSEYTYEKHMKPYIYEFTTAGLTAGGEESVEMEMVSNTFSNVTVELTASEGATMVYYQFYTTDQFNAFADMAAVTENLLGAYVTTELQTEVRATNCFREQDIELTQGQNVILAALAVDGEGKYGQVTYNTFSTKKIEYSTTFTASFGEEVSAPFNSGYTYDFPITVTGGEAAKYYYVFSSVEFADEDLQNLPLTYDYNYDFKSTTSGVAEGMLKGQYVGAGDTYYLAVVVESAEGEFAPVIKKTVTAPAAAEE